MTTMIEITLILIKKTQNCMMMLIKLEWQGSKASDIVLRRGVANHAYAHNSFKLLAVQFWSGKIVSLAPLWICGFV